MENRLVLNSCGVLWFDLFFFQAEVGIRDLYVTGVQTCALPISTAGVPDDAGVPSAGALAADAVAGVPAVGGGLVGFDWASGATGVSVAAGSPCRVTAMASSPPMTMVIAINRNWPSTAPRSRGERADRCLG